MVLRVRFAVTVRVDDPEAKYTVPETLVWATGKVVVERNAWEWLLPSV